MRTAHHVTSQLPERNTIAGKFDDGENILKTANPELYFKMEANDHGFFETAISGIPPDTIPRTERIDLVIGSGGKGQTYLYWKNDLLFQLPVSYWTELKGWANSPGYRDGGADFRRPIPPRCLDCHATYFESLAPPPNRYGKTGFVLGISCEKCHGPGGEHVALQNSKAQGSPGQAMVNPENFRGTGSWMCAPSATQALANSRLRLFLMSPANRWITISSCRRSIPTPM